MVCDAELGLYPVDEGAGCLLRVALHPDWQLVVVFFAAAVLVCLAALVVSQLRRGG